MYRSSIIKEKQAMNLRETKEYSCDGLEGLNEKRNSKES